jgi:hypothetical protein
MRLTRGSLLKQDDWIDWQTPEFLQLDQYADQSASGTQLWWTRTTRYFIWYGHIISRLWMVVRRPAAFVMALVIQAQLKFLMKSMPTVSTRPARDSFTQSRLPKTSLFLGQTSATCLLRHPCQSKDSTYALTAPFTNGGKTSLVTTHSPGSCHPHSLGNAGPPRITTTMGETRRRNPQGTWTYTYYP